MIEHLRVIVRGNRFIAGVMKAALDAIRERLRGISGVLKMGHFGGPDGGQGKVCYKWPPETR
jgi:hypothetical protein